MKVKAKPMPKKWYQELVNLCYVQSYSANEKLMILYLDKKLSELGLKYTIDGVGNVIVTKGVSNTYPCVVSHMDTVHKVVKNYQVFKQDQNLFSETGIGGDDKCGIFACLYLLEILPIIKVVFFTQEETGCKGSNSIDKTFFDNCRYLIQLDRKGSSDFIDTKYRQKTVSHAFSSELGKLKKDYGFKSTEGSITDVVNLWSDGVGLSCLNLSSGFYKPHSKDEFIDTIELWNSVLFTKDIIKTLKSKKYPSIRQQIKSHVYTSNINTKIYCRTCKKIKERNLGTFVNQKFMCYQCCQKSITHEICGVCYKPVDINDLQWSNKLQKKACSKCRGEDEGKRICDVCNRAMYVKHGRMVGDNFVCYQCNIEDARQQVKKELAAVFTKAELKTEECSVCKLITPKSKGEYDGELFICDNCFTKKSGAIIESGDRDIIIAKECCDKCLNQVSVSDGVYGDGGGTFICYACISRGEKFMGQHNDK